MHLRRLRPGRRRRPALHVVVVRQPVVPGLVLLPAQVEGQRRLPLHPNLLAEGHREHDRVARPVDLPTRLRPTVHRQRVHRRVGRGGGDGGNGVHGPRAVHLVAALRPPARVVRQVGGDAALHRQDQAAPAQPHRTRSLREVPADQQEDPVVVLVAPLHLVPEHQRRRAVPRLVRRIHPPPRVAVAQREREVRLTAHRHRLAELHPETDRLAVAIGVGLQLRLRRHRHRGDLRRRRTRLLRVVVGLHHHHVRKQEVVVRRVLAVHPVQEDPLAVHAVRVVRRRDVHPPRGPPRARRDRRLREARQYRQVLVPVGHDRLQVHRVRRPGVQLQPVAPLSALRDHQPVAGQRIALRIDDRDPGARRLGRRPGGHPVVRVRSDRRMGEVRVEVRHRAPDRRAPGPDRVRPHRHAVVVAVARPHPVLEMQLHRFRPGRRRRTARLVVGVRQPVVPGLALLPAQLEHQRRLRLPLHPHLLAERQREHDRVAHPVGGPAPHRPARHLQPSHHRRGGAFQGARAVHLVAALGPPAGPRQVRRGAALHRRDRAARQRHRAVPVVEAAAVDQEDPVVVLVALTAPRTRTPAPPCRSPTRTARPPAAPRPGCPART